MFMSLTGRDWSINLILPKDRGEGAKKKYFSPGERGRVEKTRVAGPRGPGLEHGSYRTLGEGPQLHDTVIV